MINLEKINTIVDELYKTDDGWRFEIELNKNQFIEDGFENMYLEYVKDGVYSESFSLFVVASLFYLDRAGFFNFKENKEVSTNELKTSAEFAYLSIDLAAQSCECFKGQSNIDFTTTTFLLSFVICTKDIKDYTKLGHHIINSLNAKSCIVKRGDENDLLSWFIIELFLKFDNTQLNKQIARYPKELKYYNEALKNWDTEDMMLLEQLIYFLSELHIDNAIQFLDEIDDKDDYIEDCLCYGNVVAGALDYRSANELPFIMLFPYEILAWLKLREKAGLKNPTEYTHPLMNTPIAKMFLDIKEPLPKPKELPYAKELLEKLKEKCPDVEIPEWLGGEKTEKESEHIPSILLKSNQPAPKTGRYQATLPTEHPRAEFLKNSGFDVKTVKEGQSVGTFGLSGSDEDAIVWVYLGE